MEVKKSKKASLEKKRIIFFQIGLIFSISLVFSAFEWRSYDYLPDDLGSMELDEEEVIEIEMDEVFRPVKKMKQPKPKVKILRLMDIMPVDIDFDTGEDDDLDLNDIDDMDFDGDDEESVGYDGGKLDLNKTFSVLELGEQPSFGRRPTDLKAYINNNLKFPASITNSPGQYEVEVEFVVEKDGSLSNIKVVNADGLDYALVKRVKDLVKTMPNWNPGKYGSQEVRALVVQPIKIKIL